MATSSQLPSTHRVWPLGMERPAPSRAAEGTDRAALFGRELDRVRRPGQLLEREAGSARPEASEAPREDQGPRRAEARTDSAPTGEPTGPFAAPVAGRAEEQPFAAPAWDVEGPVAPAPPDSPGPKAPPPGDPVSQPAANPLVAASAGTRSTQAAPQASLALAAARVAEGPTPGPAAVTAAVRRDVPRVQTAAAPAATFEAVLEQIQPELRPNLRQALVVLEPADLGRVAVRVVMGPDGLTAALRAESQATKELLERHLPELRASFEASGLLVSEITVELDRRSAGHGGPGSEQHSQPQGRGESGAARASSDAAPKSTHRFGARPDGSVDTYA